MWVNVFPDTAIDLYWENSEQEEDHPERRILEASIPPRGAWHMSETYLGHEFSYDVKGKRHFVVPPPGNANGEQFITLAGEEDGFKVRCEITVNSQKMVDYLDIIVKPYLSPRGAARFLELVRAKYYDGVAFNRVVPEFLTQFGIAKDYATRTREREISIWDDFQQNIAFGVGDISFAGTGHDSRSTELFIVMPGTSQKQLDTFGENSWETPFAVIEDVENSALKKIYSGYGDVHPFNAKGLESEKMYDVDGYTTYLPKQFPKLDYVDRCYIVDEVGLGEDLSEGEF